MIVMCYEAGNQVKGSSGETTYIFRRKRTADKKANEEIEKIRAETVIAKQTAGITTDVEAREEIDHVRIVFARAI